MKLIQQQLQEKQKSAVLDIASELSGVQRTGASQRLSQVFLFMKKVHAQLDAIFNSTEQIAKFANEEIEKIKGAILQSLMLLVQLFETLGVSAEEMESLKKFLKKFGLSLRNYL